VLVIRNWKRSSRRRSGNNRAPFAAGPAALLPAVVLATAVLLSGGCGGGGSAPIDAAGSDLVLASTTSIQDSGLLDLLVPAFVEAFPQYTVKVVAVGSGEALRLGETGDADVLLVHAPAAEQRFMDRGLGRERKLVMYNEFVVIGPPSDPARVRGMADASAAFAKIAGAEAAFFSRGDDSGTYAQEKAIWQEAGIEPGGRWYVTTGQGMGETLTIADQKGGYTLSDRATYLVKRPTLALVTLVEGDTALLNRYHVITTAKGRNREGALDFMNWILSKKAQELIAGFGVEEFGRPLFVPAADGGE
jgi:tungstate transport system substrate-binding protein